MLHISKLVIIQTRHAICAGFVLVFVFVVVIVFVYESEK